MADVLAQQIYQLMSMERSSQQAALNCLADLQGRRALASPPPGLPCPPGLASPPPGLTLPPGLAKAPRKVEGISRISTMSTVCLSDDGSASRASSPSSPATPLSALARPGLAFAGGARGVEQPKKPAPSSTNSNSSKTGSNADSSSPPRGSEEELVEEPQERRRAVSTLKIKNLPRRCTQEEVLTAIATAGFDGAYDFFFLPLGGQQKRQNRGYAFINFKSVEIASRFRAAFHRYCIREKQVEVVTAPVQGVAENMERLSNPSAEDAEKSSGNAVVLLL